MKVIGYLFLAALSSGYSLHASDFSDILTQKAPNTSHIKTNHNLDDFLNQTKFFSPKEKLEFARRMPQTTTRERRIKSAAHLALQEDPEVLFYLKVKLDEACR